MFQMLGFEKQSYPNRLAMDPSRWLRFVAAHDSATLILLKRDLGGWLEENRRFAVVYLPQVGHGPWPDLDGTTVDLASRCRKLIAIQDRSLGELLDILAHHNRLERTIIVVTADHGVRTRQEDPAFEGGKIDDYSFRVPFLVYAPGIVQSPTTVSNLTSHIDVVPTVLDLFGVDGGREFEQGNPIWDPELSGRTTFFFANGYLGADGFYAHGGAFSWNHLTNTVYAATGGLHFDENAIVPASAPVHVQVTTLITRMRALQQAWIRAMRAGNADGPVTGWLCRPGAGSLRDVRCCARATTLGAANVTSGPGQAEVTPCE